MKAIVSRSYGLRNLKLEEVPKPVPGADEVLDYTKEGFALPEGGFDLILAIRGYMPMEANARALAPGGCYVMAGGSWKQVFQSMARGPRVLAGAGKRFGRFTYSPKAEDLAFMKDLIEAGKVKPIIDSVYPLRDIAEAFRHFGKGHARGKVVIRVRLGGAAETDGGES
jgi:NADPH:quinone reductase and related Zn-dependent oxidoreductases